MRHAFSARRFSSQIQARCFTPKTLKPSPAPTAQQFLQLLQEPSQTTPLLFRSLYRPTSEPLPGLIKSLLDKQGNDRLVDVEIGRYDKEETFDRAEVRLSAYLAWLESGGKKDQLVYLAQWKALDEVPDLKSHFPAPTLLSPLLEQRIADLYESSFFVGPTGAITPLHSDPYENLFTLPCTSSPSTAKHFLIFPRSLSALLRKNKDMRHWSPGENTSLLDFEISRGEQKHSEIRASWDVRWKSDNVDERESIEDGALQCTLMEGDALFIPRGSWHRVENVDLEGNENVWTAGVGWWFRTRGEGGVGRERGA
ncbi:Clavaminate synthase-like protein [Atractiella rhizophila]|nr:Clavaminate synthase-like protein [Atractiella rhizophila]